MIKLEQQTNNQELLQKTLILKLHSGCPGIIFDFELFIIIVIIIISFVCLLPWLLFQNLRWWSMKKRIC